MMRGGKQVTVPILGMNNELLNDQSIDGLCDSIVNLKPKGDAERPYWAPFEVINNLKNSTGVNFSYPFGIASITDAFWQTRNFIGDNALSQNQSLKRLLVLCQNNSRKCIDILEPTNWTVVKTQALPLEGVYSWSCTRLDEVTIIAITRDKKPFAIYYLIDDAFIPAGWPEMPTITVTTETEAVSGADLAAGNTKGVLREDEDQWFMAKWCFRLFDGTQVKHQAPVLIKIDAGAPESVMPKFTLVGYSEADSPLINQEFWTGLISGISVACTIPRNVEQDALDDGAFFQVGYWGRMDRLPEAEWPTATDPNIIIVDRKSDAWPLGSRIGIDNFTHHKYSARVVDTYNKRLLLGGSSVDFALPRIGTNTTQNTIPGGVYSDYMTYLSGLATFSDSYFDADGNVVGSPDDPDYSYEINSREYDGTFTPLAGREFKSVTIESQNPATDGAVTPPGGGSDLPSRSFSAAIVAGNLVLGIDTVETNFGVGGSFSASPFMRLKVEIGPVGSPADQTIFFDVSPAGNTAPFLGFSGVDLQINDVTVTAKVYHRITIKTDSGTYYRIQTGDISESQTTVELPELIWYPDRRATLYELIVENDGVYEVALSRQLIQHPSLNYSYVILSTAEQTYTIGDSTITTTEPDLSVNFIQQYVPNRIQASISGNPFVFDPIATYRVGSRENDTILGFGVNLNPTSEGQAGQYPLYAFSDKGVWALEQIEDPQIAFGRISPVSNFNGINNPYAIANAGNLIIAVDNKYIYAMAGLETTRIDRAIANDPDYADYLKQIRIGYHRATDYEELIFSNPFYDYSLHYNLSYKVWYKGTERFKFFFYDYPELMGLTAGNAMKDFSDKNSESPVAWELTTRVIQLQEPYVYKRLYPSYVRMRVKQPLKENPEQYTPVRFQLKGYRDSPTTVYTLYDQSVKSDQILDYRIYNQYGSMYAYRVIMSGNSMHKHGQIQGLDAFIEYRYAETRRRLNSSGQFFYENGESGISICRCANTSKNYYVYPGYITQEVFTIPASVHGFTREPDVTLRDQEGYTFEAPVRVHPTTFDITILVRPSIPYRVLLT